MVRPVSGQSFLGTEPESSFPVLECVPHGVRLDPIQTRQGGPHVAIIARDTAGSPDPQNPLRILRESGDDVVQQAVLAFLVGRKLSIGQPVQAPVGADPKGAVRSRQEILDATSKPLMVANGSKR